MPDPTKLLQLLNKKTPAGLWSRGVTLARQDAVAMESQDETEMVLRVRAPGRPVALTVVLYPQDLEWDCDCGSRITTCEHVAAAAIMLGKAAESSADIATEAQPVIAQAAQRWGCIAYRFHSAATGEGVRLERSIAHPDGNETPLGSSLAALLARPAEAQKLHVEQSDLLADQIAPANPRVVLPATTLEALLRILSTSRTVYLDGQPVAVSDEVVTPVVTVADRGDDIVVTIAKDPRVHKILGVGLGVAGDTLCRLGETTLAGGYWQNLPIVRVIGPRERGEAVTKLLPDLSKRMEVDVRSDRLPRIVRGIVPRIVIRLEHVPGGLTVFPTLVYGAPPCVRIDDTRMVHLGGPVPVRDEGAEKELILRLRADLNLVPGRRVNLVALEAAPFMDKLRRWRGDVVGNAANSLGANLKLVPNLVLQTTESNRALPASTFELTFRVEGQLGPDGGSRTVSAAAVLSAYRDGLGLVPLDGGGFAPLPTGWLAKHADRVAALLAAREDSGRVSTHALPILGELCRALDHPPPPGLDKLAPLADGFQGLATARLPDDLRAELRPYQQTGVDWLCFLRDTGLGGILADDMGLGKTLQAIAALKGPALVVCPTSVLSNWRKELNRFRPGLNVSVYHGPGRQLDPKADVTLTSYALMRLDGATLANITWKTAILDEAQAIKNPTSQVAQAAFGLKADFKLALTGTPVENRLDELWSLCHFTNRGLLGGRRDFDDKVATPIAEGKTGAAEELRRHIKPFLLRRKKAEVAPELPPRTEAVLAVELDERERLVYDTVRAASRKEVESLATDGKGVMQALEALLRLRQACCHSALVPGQRAESSSKIEALVEALATISAEGHKALVFSQWTSLLDLVEPRLQSAALPFVRLDGSTHDRESVVAKFQADDGPPVMLISLKAGGTGLNLTAADHVFLCDPWWNPAVEAQAADRAHRIGQDKPVLIYRLVAQNTVEERILALQEKKRALMEAAVGVGDAAGGLTRQDLLDLLA